jgi:MoaA/NifB/PqqE/SkfB family radical SAM enzyme
MLGETVAPIATTLRLLGRRIPAPLSGAAWDEHCKWVQYCHDRSDGKKAVLEYPPRWITIGITGNCSLTCEFCCNHSPASKASPVTSHQYKMGFNLTPEEFERAVRMSAEAGVPRVHVCGTGEPFFHPRVLDLLDIVTSIYPITSLQTNFVKPVFEKRGYVDAIIERGDSISYITTDMFGPAIHEKVKQGSDFAYLLDCMERVSKETPILFDVHIVLTRSSYEGSAELLETLHRRGVRFVMNIGNLFALGFNAFTSLDNAYRDSDVEIKAELDRVARLASDLGIQVRIPLPWGKANDQRRPCKEFWNKVQLMPSKKLPRERWPGNAIPQQCPADVVGDIFSIGNLFDYRTFMEFWNNERLVAIRRRIIEGHLPDEACRACPTGAQGFAPSTTADALRQRIPNRLTYLRRRARRSSWWRPGRSPSA